MMGGLDKVEKIVIGFGGIRRPQCSLAGICIYASWHAGTHPDYGMETVKTGDVTWVCPTDHGKTIGCDTVEEYK